MFSQNVAKITPPSHFYFRSQLPLRQDIKQWKAVYYFSGLSNRVRRSLALQDKAALVEATRAFEGRKVAVLSRDDAVQSALLPILRSGAGVGVVPDNNNSSTKISAAEAPERIVAHVVALNEMGFTDLSTPYIHVLHSHRGAKKGETTAAIAAALETPADYARLIGSYKAEAVRHHLFCTSAKYDYVQSLKQVAEHRAAERAGEAARVLELAIEKFAASPQNASAAASGALLTPEVAASLAPCFNAYMDVMLTCGFDGMQSVPNFIYDKMGELGVTPTLTTYENVILALGLIGEMAEAEQVANFVISRGFPAAIENAGIVSSSSASSSASSSSSLSGGGHSVASIASQKLLPIYHALLMGYRENRMFDKCDLVWAELVQNRQPRPNATTAEIYLRSIVDHSYTRTSDTYARFAELNTVEKKRIPIVLAQMDELSIPRTHLSAPLHHEVEDALRKFSIYKDRFYNWGRAVKQFNFIEFRRRNGWLYGLDEMLPTIFGDKTPRRLPWASGEEGAISPIAAMEVPVGVFDENRPWLEEPLSNVLSTVTYGKERMDDTRAAEYFYNEHNSIHDRKAGWSSEVPQTRYDQMYGLSKPNLHQAGVRRHLASEWADGVLGGEERAARDEAVLKAITSTARRSRHRPEVHSTHRTSPLDGAF